MNPPTLHRIWHAAIDTGGTFTDCIAIDPHGRLHRVKVLSSSAVRGVIERHLASTALQIHPDAIFATASSAREQRSDGVVGLGFQALGLEHPPVTVESFDAASGRLTLSDAIAELPAGATFELVSPEEAPLLALRLATGTALDRELPPCALRVATTRGTNTLLERRGAKVALFVTRGFADLLEIGTQQRPDLFALDIEKRRSLAATVIEVDERVAADGEVIETLAADQLTPRLSDLVAGGYDSAAIAFLNSYRAPEHELQLARMLESAGFRHVSASARLAPSIKILPRAETSVVNAYLGEVVSTYLNGIGKAVDRDRLHVMTSAGGLVKASEYEPKDSLLSGPAGGVAGAASVGSVSGFDRVISFDMGGTSTDVARYDGEFEYVFEHRVGDAHLMAPALAIESVAAGGGSICRCEHGRLHVGPESARADPGPACYGRGGPLTITDVNLLSGRLDPARFRIPVDVGAAKHALAGVRETLARQTGESPTDETLLDGFLDIANERMADAIRAVSLGRGYDPADYALVAFGGAGGQHACAIASRLAITHIVVPADAGLLSASGILSAAIERFAERTVLEALDQVDERLATLLRELESEAFRAIAAEGSDARKARVRRRIAHLRFLGQDEALAVELGAEVAPPREKQAEAEAEGEADAKSDTDAGSSPEQGSRGDSERSSHRVEGGRSSSGAGLRAEFLRAYKQRFGHLPEQLEIELVSLRVVVATDASAQVSAAPPRESNANAPTESPKPQARVRARCDRSWQGIGVFERQPLAPGTVLRGPCLVVDDFSTTLIEAAWSARVDAHGSLLLTRPTDCAQQALGATTFESTSEAVLLELFTNRFAAIAEEMGEMLRRTSLSTNVKERLDYSCAVLDADGELVVNAPHIPVHLGALGLCVRTLRDHLEMRPGDIVVTNHPAYGGSHLPDITVVAPVYAPSSQAGSPEREDHVLVGYVASRAHHAEIGGIRPGSMPPDATRLQEEGVVIPPLRLVEGGKAHWDRVRSRLQGGAYPSRAVGDNLADLHAAVAASHRGSAALEALARTYGVDSVTHYMDALKENAAKHVQRAIDGLLKTSYEAVEHLDDGARLKVRIERLRERTCIDFSGTSATHAGNLNATPAIVQSAVLYVLRLLVDEPLPLNDGLLRAVEIRLPQGTLLSPSFPADDAAAPAVVGGNVETSQRLVDTLLKAFGRWACSQGTMNNVLFGAANFGYYETVCGGSGAGEGFHGASAVHTHMTNTRMTDAEVIEHRYPVRVERFAVRRGSGGQGRWRGGDGALRELVFLAPMALSILSQHRTQGPYGMAGGEAGTPGRQRLVRADGSVEKLTSVDGREVFPGDRLILETPGGGGYGSRETE